MSRLIPRYLKGTETVQKTVEDFLNTWYNESDEVSTFTSGSTGSPKEIRIKKTKMIASARMTGEYLQLKKGMTALLCLSPETIGGKMMIVRAIVLQLDLVVAPICSSPLRELKEEIDFIALVPMQLANSLVDNTQSLKSISHVIVGGGIITPELEAQLEGKQISVHQTFGMTETISHIAMRKAGFASEATYTALDSTTFTSTIDGRLVIHSTLLEEGSIETNDCIELLDEKHFEWKGRADFVINSGGVKIHPEEVEKKLSRMLPCTYFITSVSDAYLGERVVLCVESKIVKSYLKSDFASYLNPFEIPKEIYYIEQFLRTPSGKIDRFQTLMLKFDSEKII